MHRPILVAFIVVLALLIVIVSFKKEGATLAGSVLTFYAILVALFKEELQRFWRRPILDVSIKTEPPDCHKSLTIYQGSKTGKVLEKGYCYYLRLWVFNKGNLPATNVQVFATKLLKEIDSKDFIEVGDFLPMNLRWAHTKEIFRSCIAPKIGRHCDLGHISDPRLKLIHNETRHDVPEDKTVLFLDLEVQPLTFIHLLQPGNYDLKIIIAADNTIPVEKTVKIMLSGEWFDAEREMFGKGIRIAIK